MNDEQTIPKQPEPEPPRGNVSASTLLLGDIISLRDECRNAQRDLIPAADPTGDARMAYGIVADHLTAMILRHQAMMAPNA